MGQLPSNGKKNEDKTVTTFAETDDEKVFQEMRDYFRHWETKTESKREAGAYELARLLLDSNRVNVVKLEHIHGTVYYTCGRNCRKFHSIRAPTFNWSIKASVSTKIPNYAASATTDEYTTKRETVSIEISRNSSHNLVFKWQIASSSTTTTAIFKTSSSAKECQQVIFSHFGIKLH